MSILESAFLPTPGPATVLIVLVLLGTVAGGPAHGWNRQAARKTLATREAVSCTPEVDRHKMALVMSDGYRTGMMHYHFLYGRVAPPFAKMRDAGIHLHVTSDLAMEPGGQTRARECS